MANLLKDKTVFITGASSGFGKAISYLFASRGANLIISARRKERIDKIASELKNKYKVKILAFQLDVRNYQEVTDRCSKLPKDWQKIDILINNAGLSRGLNKIHEGILSDWEEMLDTNVKGLLYVTKNILNFMIKRQKGHIINIGSIAGHEVYPGGNVYCASKYAVDALTKSMRIDLLDKNIKVSTIDPGLVNTEFALVRYHGDKEKAQNTYKGMKPLTAKDIAEIVEFIATRNDNVNIAEIIVFPKSQGSSTIVNRK